MATETQSVKQDGERKRAKGLFPRLPLSKAIELTEAIYKLGHGEEVRRRTVFNDLGKSPDSGGARALIAASNSGYNLTTGSQTAEYLGLDENGLLYSKSSSEDEKYAVIYKILINNEIFADFIQHFNDRPFPVDEVAVDYIKKTHGIVQDDAQVCFNIIKTNMTDYRLVEELSGKSVIITPETALEKLRKKATKPSIVKEDGGHPEEAELPKSDGNRKNQENGKLQEVQDIIPQITFNIQIVLPENASSETYDNIFKSIATNLLQRNRS